MTTSTIPEPGAAITRDDPVERSLPSWFYIMIVLMVLITVFSIWHGTKFADRTNFQNIALDASQLMLLAIGSTFVIMTAGIDLSVSAMLVLSAICGAKTMVSLSGSSEEVRRYVFPEQNTGITIGLIVAVLTGLAAGLANGLHLPDQLQQRRNGQMRQQ